MKPHIALVASAALATMLVGCASNPTYTRRPITVGGQEFGPRLPCEPLLDDSGEEGDQADGLVSKTYSCRDEERKIIYFVLVGTFKSESPDPNPSRDAKLANKAARSLCAGWTNGHEGATCEPSAPEVRGGMTVIDISLGAADREIRLPARVRVAYPYMSAAILVSQTFPGPPEDVEAFLNVELPIK